MQFFPTTLEQNVSLIARQKRRCENPVSPHVFGKDSKTTILKTKCRVVFSSNTTSFLVHPFVFDVCRIPSPVEEREIFKGEF